LTPDQHRVWKEGFYDWIREMEAQAAIQAIVLEHQPASNLDIGLYGYTV